MSCPSDCHDFPNGGLDRTSFCPNGVLGEDEPLLTGGAVGHPFVDGSIFSGNSRCTALPTTYWAQSPDRKTCVRR